MGSSVHTDTSSGSKCQKCHSVLLPQEDFPPSSLLFHLLHCLLVFPLPSSPLLSCSLFSSLPFSPFLPFFNAGTGSCCLRHYRAQTMKSCISQCLSPQEPQHVLSNLLQPQEHWQWPAAQPTTNRMQEERG